MKRLRCGFSVPLSEMEAGDRKVIDDFRRFLQGELAIAEDGQTYVDPEDPRATYFGGKPEEKS